VNPNALSHTPSGAAARDPFARALERYRALPRSGKWIAAAGVALTGWLLLDSVLWPIADKLNARADNMAGVLERAASRAESLPGNAADAAVVLGPNSSPRPEAETKAKLSAAVDAALKKKSITNYGFDMRVAQALPQTVLPDVAARGGGQMGRLAADLARNFVVIGVLLLAFSSALVVLQVPSRSNTPAVTYTISCTRIHAGRRPRRPPGPLPQ
jgi:hypothetical protein